MAFKPRLRDTAACPCGSGLDYGACCGAIHAQFVDSGKLSATTPEALMRSRYSAYSLGLLHYLLATWHPSTAPGELELGFTKWLSLEVLHSEASTDAGVVEFVAKYKANGKAETLHEISRFVWEGPAASGAWLYVDGIHPD